MRIIDQTKTAERPTTLTTDIPVGQVFRGEMLGVNSGKWVAGVFYKAYGDNNVRGSVNGQPRAVGGDHIIVRLDSTVMRPGYANVGLYETWVRNYEPLEVELVIKGVQR